MIMVDGRGTLICGATLLRVRDDVDASDIVLTAGHCGAIPDTL